MLVTGATGTVGSRLVPLLAERGWRIRALVHRRPAPSAHETVTGDLADPGALRGAASGMRAIVHLAGVTHARRSRTYVEANLAGTQRLLDAALEEGVDRFLYVSTRASSLEGGGYSASKRRAEEAVRASPIRHTIVRLAEVYGGGGSEGVDRMVALAARGRPIPMVGRGGDRIYPLHVEDAAQALADLVEDEQAAGMTYSVLGESMTVREFAQLCRSELGSRSRVVPVPPFAVATAAAVSRVLPLPIYPDQLSRLRNAPSPPSSADEAVVEVPRRPLRGAPPPRN